MKRLPAIFSCISPCDLFVDIGTDHGFIADFAAKMCKKVIAADISDQCLAKAKTNILAKNVDFRVGDGLSVLDSDPDLVAICGMGGLNIISVMSGYNGKASFILQPQSDIAAVRRFLSDSYTFIKDFLCFERGKFYDILLVKPQKDFGQILDECALSFGVFYKEKNEVLAERLLKLKKEISEYKQTPQNIKKLKLINQALDYQN